MASVRHLLLSAVAVLLATSATALNIPTSGGDGFCPINSGAWSSGKMSDGLIFNDGNSILSKIEDGSIKSETQCAAKCAATTDCAFFSYISLFSNLLEGCYLYKCGACTSGTSYGSLNAINKLLQFIFGLLGLLTKLGTCKSGANPLYEKFCKGVKGDPHFNGADNSHFEFTGLPNNTYAMLTDAHLQVNMHLGGRYAQWGDNPSKPLTWIRQIGILWGRHTIALKTREGARWQYDAGYMGSIEVDGKPVVLAKEGDSVSLVDGKVEIAWVAAAVKDGDDLIDVYLVRIADVISMRLKLRPEVAHLRTLTDGVVHFSMELPQVELSENAHGVLGQTYRHDHRNRLATQKLVYSKLLGVDVVPAENGVGFLDGTMEDYKVSGLLQPDCKLTRFARATQRDTETAQAMEISSGAAYSTISTSGKVLESAARFARRLLL